MISWRLWPVTVALAVAAIAAALPGAGAAGSTAPRFAPPVYVDQQLAGGEPEVFADALHGRLIYSAHEGTTHLYRDGITSSPWGNFAFVANYCNQVNTWTSPDGGVNWYRDRYLGTDVSAEPDLHRVQRPRSDPGRRRARLQHRHQPCQRRDLLVDRRRPDVGQGHGLTATTATGRGSPAALADQVFMSSNTLEGDGSGHQIFVSTDGGNTCSADRHPG